jgi:peptidyl-prolyl cis-trans isomerase SurA
MKIKWLLPILLFSYFCQAQELIDGVAAIVGENVILKSEVDQFARLNASQLRIDPTKDTEAYLELLKRSLSALIDENILLEQAKIETIEVKDRDVENTLNQQIENMISQAGSKEAAEQILGSSITKIKRDYRSVIKNRLIVEKLRTEKFQKTTVSRREINKFYETYKDSLPEIPPTLDFSHILFVIKPGLPEEANAIRLGDSLLTAIKSGADFSELAKSHSDDLASAVYGGDLGYIKRGGFIKEFEEVAFSLQPNEISTLVKTDFGYHIIQMIDRKGENINVRHILIKPKVSEQNTLKTKAFADSVYNLINNGLDFDSAAVYYSDDPDVKITKGRIRRIPKNQIQQPEFITVLDSLKYGQLSSVFQSSLGFHILRLNAIYDDTWITLEQWALEYKKNQLYREWVDELRSQFFIDIK